MDRYEIVYWLVVQVPKIPLSSSQSNRLSNLFCPSQPQRAATCLSSCVSISRLGRACVLTTLGPGTWGRRLLISRRTLLLGLRPGRQQKRYIKHPRSHCRLFETLTFGNCPREANYDAIICK